MKYLPVKNRGMIGLMKFGENKNNNIYNSPL